MITIPPRIRPSRARLSPEQYERIEREAVGQANAIGFIVFASIFIVLDVVIICLGLIAGFSCSDWWVLIASIPVIAFGIAGLVYILNQDQKDAERIER